MTQVEELVLPTKPVPISSLSPRRLFLYSKPKVGKTTLLSKLDNCLIIDLEYGTDSVEALKVAAESYEEVQNIISKIIKEKLDYKYIALDTISKLEELALPFARKLYKATPMGASWNGKDVRTLPQGAGYLYLRTAVLNIINGLEKTGARIILVGHTKDAFIEKQGKEVSSIDIDLTGRLKSIVASKMDAVGFLKRNPDNEEECIITFKGKDELICGARPEHLRGQEIVLGKSINNNKDIEAYWDRIYID